MEKDLENKESVDLTIPPELHAVLRNSASKSNKTISELAVEILEQGLKTEETEKESSKMKLGKEQHRNNNEDQLRKTLQNYFADMTELTIAALRLGPSRTRESLKKKKPILTKKRTSVKQKPVSNQA